MIHLVGGKHRTGTSMMVRAISLATGMTAVGQPGDPDSVDSIIRSREARNDPQKDQADPNPNGYWMANWGAMANRLGGKSALVTHLQGKVAKIHLIEAARFPANVDARIVWMTRDETARRTSWTKAFGTSPQDWEDPLEVLTLAHLATLPRVSVVTIDFDAVMTNPSRELQKLVDTGWITSPQLVAFIATIDLNLYRNLPAAG